MTKEMTISEQIAAAVEQEEAKEKTLNANTDSQPDPAALNDLAHTDENLGVDLEKVPVDDEPTINPELHNLLDIQDQRSYDELKKLIEKDGVQNPITIWQEENVIVDGHNRKKIAEELGIPLPKQYMSFPDIGAAKEWIIRNQLGRRNLTPQRMEYFIGQLYNTTVAQRAAEDNDTTKGLTAENLSKEFQVSPKTVRRYGEKAKAVDLIAKVKGRLAKDKQLSSKPEYNTEEERAIAKAPNLTVASKTIAKLDVIKKEKEKEKKVQAKVDKTTETNTAYHIALVEPHFDETGWQQTSETKPTLDKDAIVFMIVPDEYLPAGVKLIERWGLQYEAGLVFFSSKDHYEGAFTKVIHTHVLIGTKGHIVGPKKGKEPTSCVPLTGDLAAALGKLVGDMLTPNLNRIDMRVGKNTLNGWDKVS